jgi:outer membrane protein
MSKDKQETAQKALIQKEQNVNVFKQQKFAQGGDVYKKQAELLDPVKAKIMKGIEEVSKEEGMNFVFDKSGDIVLLYADTTFDITNRVLDKLKRGK